MLGVLQEARATILENFCGKENTSDVKGKEINFKEPNCPFPNGVEIPFVIGKFGFDCEGWGLEVGEGAVLNIDHKTGGETTMAIGPGLELATPKIFGHNNFSLNPSISTSAKGQLFLTFEGGNLVDGGFLWEAELDLKGLRKPEIKQNFTFAVNKGFTYEGALTDLGDKIFGFPPETQINKNIKIYKPPH